MDGHESRCEQRDHHDEHDAGRDRGRAAGPDDDEDTPDHDHGNRGNESRDTDDGAGRPLGVGLPRLGAPGLV